MKKPKVAFPFVEAGLGHIMPMTAVCDVFERKYGDKVDIVKVRFFNESGNKDLAWVEEQLIKEVKGHNNNKLNSFYQFALMKLVGSRCALDYLHHRWWRRGYKPAIDYVASLDADLIFNTHFTPLYYSCEAKKLGLINSKIMAYCPDPVIGNQWDCRCESMSLSSYDGIEETARKRMWKKAEFKYVPFLIRKEVEQFTEDKKSYREQLGLPTDNFTILLADGAYGAGKLEKTVRKLLNSNKKMTIIAVCGKNEELYQRFLKWDVPSNVTFRPYGFTKEMLLLSACCDLFIGKAGASNLAEPVYFGAPAIVNFTATPVEKWICNHYTKHLKCAVKITNINKVVKLALSFVDDPSLMSELKDNCSMGHHSDGPEQLADYIYSQLDFEKE